MLAENEHGQPIGVAVDWTPAQSPGRRRLDGRYVGLEPIARHHAPDLLEALCGDEDAPLWTYRSDERPDDLGQMRERIMRWQQSESHTWALVPRAAPRPAGLMTLTRIDQQNGTIEVGAIILSRQLQRTCAATEALFLLACYVFETLGYRRLEWKLDTCNRPSAVAAERYGFTFEGTFRKAVVYHGRNRDTHWYAVTDDEWAVLRPCYEQWLSRENFDESGEQRARLSSLTASVKRQWLAASGSEVFGRAPQPVVRSAVNRPGR